MSRERSNLEVIVLQLLEKMPEISLQDVAQAARFSKFDERERKIIQRVLKGLVEREILQIKGRTRARIYFLKKKTIKENLTPFQYSEEHAFKDIPLSERSVELLQYLSKSIQTRHPAGYNQDFLRSYEPNRSSYLSQELQIELLTVGRAENAVRPAGTYARNILDRLLIYLSWNSSRLEGNTYSLLETKRLIELGENAAGKEASETQMILNHKSAIEYIIESSDEPTTSSHVVCSIHALLSENLLGDPGASGRVRKSSVGISGTTYIPLDNPHVLKECFEIFIEKMNLIEDPFEQSFFSLVHLSYMQAFEDVNKRTARLVANIALIKRNLRPLSFTDINKEAYVKSLLGIYEKNDISLLRDLYICAYKRSSQQYSAIQQSMGEPNLLKLKHRAEIQIIIRTVILEKTVGREVVAKVQNMLKALELPVTDATKLFQIIETEILSLHDGNIARFKVRPSEFQDWKRLQ